MVDRLGVTEARSTGGRLPPQRRGRGAEMLDAPRALLLSGSLGAGHDVEAAAVAQVLGEEGWATTTLDSMALLGGRGGAAGEAVFRRLLERPGLYDAFHFACLRPGTAIARWADRGARHQVVPRLGAAMLEQRPDVVLAVFATGASAAAELARSGSAPPVVAFCTDVTPHRLWVHTGIDAYLVICKAAEAAVRRYQPHATVRVVPRPVRPEFTQVVPQVQARPALGIPPEERCVLLMSGGWGLGPVVEAAEAMMSSAPGLHVLAVAGTNAELEAGLVRRAEANPRLHPFGFTREVPLLMSASDLVITTSGVTCSEARAVGRELLLIDEVPGHGRENLQHELELGHAAVTSAEPALLAAAALATLEHAELLAPEDPMPGFVRGLHDVLEGLGLAA